jgi:hypothetical protein
MAADEAERTAPQDAQQVADIYARENLVAWCIVPFDAKKRGPEERAKMLARLGFHRYAYDWREEHLASFDKEVRAVQKRGIELTACWFPTHLNEHAQMILDVLKRHNVQTQLWVSGGGSATKSDQQQRVEAEANRIRPIAEAAAKGEGVFSRFPIGG